MKVKSQLKNNEYWEDVYQDQNKTEIKRISSQYIGSSNVKSSINELAAGNSEMKNISYSISTQNLN